MSPSQEKLEIPTELIRVLQIEGYAVLACAERLMNSKHSTEVIRAVEMMAICLRQGGKIIVTGVGKSGKIAQKIAATLCSTGSLAVYLHPTEGLHGDLGIIQPQDVVLALSYTGNTEELLRLLPSLRRIGVNMIGMGGNSHSRLAMASQAWIDVAVSQEACPYNLAPTSSSTLALAMGDAIAVTLMQMNGKNEDDFRENHPGGALGNRLRLKVKDLMHPVHKVATVKAHTLMEEVISVATEKKLGAVVVVESNRLVGIITDGDIRKSLQHREKFFTMKAQEVMTQNPVVISPDAVAYSALELMEHRTSQISVLPVVDSEGEWMGLIRLHDLVQTF